MSQAHETSRDQITGQSPQSLEGKRYGPYPLRVCAEKVGEFVSATSDDPHRWRRFAPPGWAAVILFAVAPSLLTDPELGDSGDSVIHGEQRFAWRGPFQIESNLEISGAVTRVRARGGVFFTVFELEAVDISGIVLSGSSTFLMSGSSAPGGASETLAIPFAAARGSNDPLPASTDEFPTLRRSASRADLVRYAAATRDWNPIHWDHDSAVEAGLPTVVVHGLLQASWILGAASSVNPIDAPLLDARFRFRTPMVAGAEAVLSGSRSGSQVAARLTVGEVEMVSANMTLR